MSNVVEAFEHAGHSIRIMVEEDGRFADPRDADNIETLVCWHPDYILGDYQIRDGAGRGGVDNVFETASGRTSFRSMEHLRRYIALTQDVVGPILPLYLLDHSGLSMTVGSASPADSGGWDTTMCGWIYVTEEKLKLCCGDSEEYREHGWIVEQLRSAVKYYSAWLEGSVYWYSVEDADGETVDSCGGYLCASEADFEELRTEARSSAEHFQRERLVELEPDLEGAAFAASQAA